MTDGRAERAKKIRIARAKHDLKQAEVAKLAGIDQSWVSRAEKGRASLATYDLIDAAFARLEADANGIEEPVP